MGTHIILIQSLLRLNLLIEFMNNTTEITIDGTVYTVDLAQAQKAGLIKKKTIKRQVEIKDVPMGSVFVWKSTSNNKNNQFVLVSQGENGYMLTTYIDKNSLFDYSYGRSQLQFSSNTYIEGFYDQTGKFIREIEESGAN